VTVIFSKIIYNVLLLLVIALINLLVYSLFLGNNAENLPLFLLSLLLGSTGLATTLTLISAIASRAGNSPSMMAILSFPVLIPLLMTIIRFSFQALSGNSLSASMDYILVLTALITLVATLSYLLFPYLWRE
jgi:heme exporter protein B